MRCRILGTVARRLTGCCSSVPCLFASLIILVRTPDQATLLHNVQWFIVTDPNGQCHWRDGTPRIRDPTRVVLTLQMLVLAPGVVL